METSTLSLSEQDNIEKNLSNTYGSTPTSVISLAVDFESDGILVTELVASVSDNNNKKNSLSDNNSMNDLTLAAANTFRPESKPLDKKAASLLLINNGNGLSAEQFNQLDEEINSLNNSTSPITIGYQDENEIDGSDESIIPPHISSNKRSLRSYKRSLRSNKRSLSDTVSPKPVSGKSLLKKRKLAAMKLTPIDTGLNINLNNIDPFTRTPMTHGTNKEMVMLWAESAANTDPEFPKGRGRSLSSLAEISDYVSNNNTPLTTPLKTEFNLDEMIPGF